MQHCNSVFTVQHLRVKLHAVNLPFGILHRSSRTVCRMCRSGKSLRKLSNIIGMTHPGNALFRQFGKQQTIIAVKSFGLAVLAGRRRCHLTAQQMRNQLCAVANSQNRYTQLKYFFRYTGGILQIHAVRPAGKNDAGRVLLFNFCQRRLIRQYLTVNITVSDTPCNQLVILSAEIKHNNKLMRHKLFLLFYELLIQQTSVLLCHEFA